MIYTSSGSYRGILQKKIAEENKRKKPKILTWNAKLVEHHAKKRQEKRKQQDIIFRKALIEMNKPVEHIKIKNITNKLLMNRHIQDIVIDVEYYPLSENTVKIIADFGWKQLQKVISGIDKKQHAGGFNVLV